MLDRKRVLVLTEDNPIGPVRLMTTIKFGQRAAALSGVATARDRSESGPFDGAGALSWPWPDHPTCSSVTV